MDKLVLIHGATSDGLVWKHQLDYFKSKFDCHAIDLCAFNSLAAMADRILAAVPGDFYLCGTSMGGYVALDIVKRATSRVKKLGLISTTARADTPEKKAARQKDVDAGAAVYNAEREKDDHYAQFVSPTHAKNAELIRFLRDTALRVGYDCFSRHQEACMNRGDSTEMLPSLTMPVLVVGGKDDKVIPVENQLEIARLVPQSTLVIMPDVGHIAHLENPSRVNYILDGFLSGSL